MSRIIFYFFFSRTLHFRWFSFHVRVLITCIVNGSGTKCWFEMFWHFPKRLKTHKNGVEYDGLWTTTTMTKKKSQKNKNARNVQMDVLLFDNCFVCVKKLAVFHPVHSAICLYVFFSLCSLSLPFGWLVPKFSIEQIERSTFNDGDDERDWKRESVCRWLELVSGSLTLASPICFPLFAIFISLQNYLYALRISNIH